MDKAKRKALKARGKAIVEKQSAEARERLREENPFHYSDPRWAQNLKMTYPVNREYRANRSKVYSEDQVLEKAKLRDVGFHFDESFGFVPNRSWYVHCLTCRALIPTLADRELHCYCGAVGIWPEDKKVALPSRDKYTVVEIQGKGLIRPDKPKRWWQFF